MMLRAKKKHMEEDKNSDLLPASRMSLSSLDEEQQQKQRLKLANDERQRSE